MKEAPEYINSLLPAGYTICGVRLRPFSLGSYILLLKSLSPFVDCNNPRMPIYEDLLYAVYVCSHTYEEGAELEYNIDKAKEWGKAFSEELYKEIDRFQKETGEKWDIESEYVGFAEYIRYQLRYPYYTVLDNDGKSSGAHHIQNILLTATSHLGYTRQEALNGPIKALLYDYIWYAEKNGLVELFDEDQIDIIRDMERRKVEGEKV